MDRRRTAPRTVTPADRRPPHLDPGGWTARESRRDGSLAADLSNGPVIVLIPVFNDWESLALLLPRLDDALASRGLDAEVLIVDDGSTVEPSDDLIPWRSETLRRVDVLRLRRNLGHQRAITVGLAYIEDCLPARAVVVMDGDGEDNPADVPRLLDELDRTGANRVVFAERTRRSESTAFRIFYALYRLMHLLLTGQKVRVGNFSAIPRRRLVSLVVVTELWNHYAAGVIRSRQPHTSIPTSRGTRLCGRSSMNFVSLVTHGLSAISVYSDIVGVRLLVLSAVLAMATTFGIVTTTVIRVATDWAIPGWATSAVGLLLILLGQAVMAAFAFSFMILGSRHGSPFLPRRDYAYFVGSVHTIQDPATQPNRASTPKPPPSSVGQNPGERNPMEAPPMPYTYVGTELDLFAAATRWKSYVRSRVAPYLGRNVLEVGAGHGGTTRVLCDGRADRWTCLEPDPALADRIRAAITEGELPDCCRMKIGTVADLDETDRFDTILYMDVLEHIADDADEMKLAADRLAPGGHLIVLSPAHQWLFTPFDRAIGHYRRYTRETLRAAAPPGLRIVRLDYLDSVGMLASLGNRLVLKSAMPNPGQIAVWDRFLVPCSRWVDPILAHSLGKSVLGIWTR